jgi:hypothetical protein
VLSRQRMPINYDRRRRRQRHFAGRHVHLNFAGRHVHLQSTAALSCALLGDRGDRGAVRRPSSDHSGRGDTATDWSSRWQSDSHADASVTVEISASHTASETARSPATAVRDAAIRGKLGQVAPVKPDDAPQQARYALLSVWNSRPWCL